MAGAAGTMAEAAETWSGDDADPADLVAMAVHDLKTPLAALRQALQLVASGRAGTVAEAQSRFLAMALDNALVLDSLLDRLGGTLGARRAAGEIRPQRLRIEEVARFVVRALQPSAECRSLRLELLESAPVREAWADPVLVRRVLLNLVGNALKYASSGVVVTVLAEPEPSDPAFVALRVVDRGPGLPAVERESVFGARRRSRATCGDQEGAGLGLAIVRDIASAHGGRAWVEATPGGGCTFSVTLPAFGSGLGAAPLIRAAAAASTRRLELLRVEPRPGAEERVADALSGAAPAACTVLDLGAGRLGLLRPSPGDGPRRIHADVAEILGAVAALVELVGRAEASSFAADPEALVAAAGESLIPFDPAAGRGGLRG